jgi:hypothetical protein
MARFCSLVDADFSRRMSWKGVTKRASAARVTRPPPMRNHQGVL